MSFSTCRHGALQDTWIRKYTGVSPPLLGQEVPTMAGSGSTLSPFSPQYWGVHEKAIPL